MSTIISLYAGPGAGKSTSAAYIYAKLKNEGVNAELVREYVKDWAWEKRPIGVFDQFYFLGKQIRRESMLLERVDVIVTDSPVWLVAYYADRHSEPFIRQGAESAVMAYYEQARVNGHTHIHGWITRSKDYNPEGRYETQEQAEDIDNELQKFLDARGILTRETTCQFDQLDLFLKRLELI